MNIKVFDVSITTKIRPSVRALLTADDVGHAAGGINTADVFRMGGVGIIAKQECYW